MLYPSAIGPVHEHSKRFHTISKVRLQPILFLKTRLTRMFLVVRGTVH